MPLLAWLPMELLGFVAVFALLVPLTLAERRDENRDADRSAAKAPTRRMPRLRAPA
jgi:hypothetical protein